VNFGIAITGRLADDLLFFCSIAFDRDCFKIVICAGVSASKVSAVGKASQRSQSLSSKSIACIDITAPGGMEILL
jgi:hypothetical protein